MANLTGILALLGSRSFLRNQARYQANKEFKKNFIYYSAETWYNLLNREIELYMGYLVQLGVDSKTVKDESLDFLSEEVLEHFDPVIGIDLLQGKFNKKA